MIASIAPVLDRIATIESRFATSQVPIVIESTAPDLGFAGVMSTLDQGLDQAEVPTLAPEPGAVATRMGGASLADVSFAAPAAPWAATGAFAPGGGGDLGGVPYAEHFASAGARHGVPPELLAAVGWVESRYQPNAVSPAGAEGLMQLMPFVSAELGVDPYDPASAIDGAARVLAGHHRRFGSWELAIAAYHAGAGAVARAGGPPGPRTATYVERVTQRMETR